MANEIWWSGIDGLTLYAIVRRVTDRYVWNTFTAAFEAFNASNWYNAGGNTYAIALTKTQQYANVSAEYAANLPNLVAGVYTAYIYIQAGTNPAPSDGPDIAKLENIAWNGKLLVSRLPDGWN